MVNRYVRAMLIGLAVSMPVSNAALAQLAAPGPPPPEHYYLKSKDTIPVNGKGGSNLMGPYVRAEGWPQLPGGRELYAGPAVHVESPDRIYIGSRGTRAPYPMQVGWQRQTIIKWFQLPPSTVDLRHDFILDVFDGQGKLIEHWSQYDTGFPIETVQRWHVNADDPNKYNYITGSGKIAVLSHDGQKIVKVITQADVPTKSDERVFTPDGIAFASDGSFWVSSHSRVIKFSKDFEYVSQFGTEGSNPDQMMSIHDLIYDRVGHRFYICDQYAHRVVVYDDKGKLLDVWPNIISPSAIRMTKDRKYVWVGDLYAPVFTNSTSRVT